MLRAWCCVVLVPAFLRAAAIVPRAVNNVLTHRRCKADCSSLGFLQCNVLLPLTRSGDANRTTTTATTDDRKCGWLSARQWCAPRARHAIRRDTHARPSVRASLTSTGHLTDVGVDQDALSPAVSIDNVGLVLVNSRLPKGSSCVTAADFKLWGGARLQRA
jgi:hypothetical protein